MSNSKDKKLSKIKKVMEDQPVSSGRRKFTKAALMASPVIMTAASKPVWATTIRQCSASILMSAGSVPYEEQSCRSCSPGYWHNPKSCWSSAGMALDKDTAFSDFFLSTFITDSNKDNYYADEIATLTTALSSFFPKPPNGKHKNSEFMKFARSATASYLNANSMGHLLTGIPKAPAISIMIKAVFPIGRSEKPDSTNVAARRILAATYRAELEGYYEDDDDLLKCLLSNSGKNCPEYIQ